MSTVRTSTSNLDKFVTRNLRNGVDHMVVFLDSPDPDAERLLGAHPHVTLVGSEDWWRGKRPAELNNRQAINANAANAALSESPSAEWLFHLDSDEVVCLDRDELAALDPTVRAVQLMPLEAVSRWEPGAEDLFKRPLSQPELHLLVLLGVVDRPDNKAYFRGHLTGKSGVRPALDVRVGIHRSRLGSGEELPSVDGDRSRLLHYYCPTGAEFARKWDALATSGPHLKIRRTRSNLAAAMRALSAAELSPPARAHYLRELYVRTTEDKVETLAELGLLERIDADVRRHDPRPMPDEERVGLEKALAKLSHVDKRMLLTGPASDIADALA